MATRGRKARIDQRKSPRPADINGADEVGLDIHSPNILWLALFEGFVIESAGDGEPIKGQVKQRVSL